MNASLLRRADALARLNRFPNLVALLVARHGRIVFERYYRGFSGTNPIGLYSITKSVTSAAVGIAIADGRIPSVDETLSDFLPRELAAASPRASRVSLRSLLTMTAGFPGDPQGGRPSFETAPHPLHALLTRPLARAHGRFVYDSGSAQLVADAVARAEAMPEAQLVRSRLFRPLGIVDDKSWPSDSEGHTWGWDGLSLTARDVAKLGYLFLRDGRWHGRQLIPASWVRASTASHVQVRAAPISGYGYFWWRVRFAHQDGFAGIGTGYQLLVVVPRRDLVVVVGNLGSENVDDPTPIVQLLVAAAN